jgi:hypothetical protein
VLQHNKPRANPEVNFMAKFRGSGANGQYRFRNVNRKRVIGSFSGGDITADAGMILLSNLERSCGLIRGAVESIRDLRLTGLLKHTTFQILFQRIALIALGYEDVVDSNQMRRDASLRIALSKSLLKNDFGASQPTICRFENAMTARDCYRLAAWMLSFYILSHKAPKQIILDFDGSCIEAHGAQQLSFLRGHYELNMYFPLLVFDQDGWLITAVLRPGNHGEARVALPVLKRIVSKFREAWPKVELVFRADAAFNTPKIYSWCEKNNVFYVIGLKSNHGLNVCGAQFANQCRKAFHRKYGADKYVCKDWKKLRNEELNKTKALPKKERQSRLKEIDERRIRVIGDFYYRAKTWDIDRRIVAVCDYSDRGLERRFVITNLRTPFPEVVHKEFYCKRGRAEQFIKELKSFKCTRLSCQEFYANQFRLLMHGMAYLLVLKLRNLLPEVWHKTSVVGIRDVFLKIAAQIQGDRKTIFIRWSSTFRQKREFFLLCKRLDALPVIA